MLDRTKLDISVVEQEFKIQEFSLEGTFEYSMGIYLENQQHAQGNRTFEGADNEYLLNQNETMANLNQNIDEHDIEITDYYVIEDTDEVNKDKLLKNGTYIPTENNNHTLESNNRTTFEENICNGEVNPTFEVIVIDAEDHKSVTEMPYDSFEDSAVRVRETATIPVDEAVSRVRLTLISIGSFVLYFCSWGMAQSFGVMFIALLERFGGNKSETTWVESLFSGVLLVSGPITGLLIKKYGCKIVGVVGSIILTVGLVTSVFTPSLHVLYLTYGLIGGFGGSLLFTTAGVVVLEHFDKYRSLVIGLSESGAAVGTILIPLMTQTCLDEYGFRGTFLLLGGLCLQCLPAALIFIQPKNTTAMLEERSKEIENDKTNLNTEITNKDNKETGNTVNMESGNTVYDFLRTLRHTFDFINLGFMLFALSWAIFMLPFLVPFLFLPDAALSSGLSKQQAAYIASALGIGSIVGKVAFGFLGDIQRLETTIMHILPILVFGTLTLIYNYVSGFTSFMILAGFIGMTSAICDGIHPVITLQLVGPENLSVGLGFLYFVMSFTTILGSPIAGWLADTTGEYVYTFYYCAGLSYIAALTAVYVPVWKRRQKNNKQMHKLDSEIQ